LNEKLRDEFVVEINAFLIAGEQIKSGFISRIGNVVNQMLLENEKLRTSVENLEKEIIRLNQSKE